MTIPNAAAWLVPGQPGFNIERARWLTLTYDGVPLYQSAAFFRAMYATGTRVIRGFFGTSPSNDIIGLHRPPVASDLTPYFEGLDLATQAGIRCYFDATDVLPVTDWTNAGSWVPAWIETFAAAAAAYPFKAPNLIEPITVTISVGVACTLGADDTTDALLKRADAAVYEAKAHGRNQVVSRAA